MRGPAGIGVCMPEGCMRQLALSNALGQRRNTPRLSPASHGCRRRQGGQVCVVCQQQLAVGAARDTELNCGAEDGF